MPHLSIDLRAEFRAGVVEGWLSDHRAGLTPNPCIRCNGNVRLDAMLDLARRLGAATLATGHYARVERSGPEPLLMTAMDIAKDQSYVLSGLAPESLERLRFPLGELHKPEVRELARAAGLPVACKRDSQDLCFLAGTGREAFLERHGGMRRRPGPVRDPGAASCSASMEARTSTRSVSAAASASPPRARYTCSPRTSHTNTVTVGPRSELLSGRDPGARDRPASPRRGGRRSARPSPRPSPRLPPARRTDRRASRQRRDRAALAG